MDSKSYADLKSTCYIAADLYCGIIDPEKKLDLLNKFVDHYPDKHAKKIAKNTILYPNDFEVYDALKEYMNVSLNCIPFNELSTNLNVPTEVLMDKALEFNAFSFKKCIDSGLIPSQSYEDINRRLKNNSNKIN